MIGPAHPASSNRPARRTRIRRRPVAGAPAAGARAGGRSAARPTAGAAGGAIRPTTSSPIRCAGSRRCSRPGRCCEVDAAKRATGASQKKFGFRYGEEGTPRSATALPRRQTLCDRLPARSWWQTSPRSKRKERFMREALAGRGGERIASAPPSNASARAGADPRSCWSVASTPQPARCCSTISGCAAASGHASPGVATGARPGPAT